MLPTKRSWRCPAKRFANPDQPSFSTSSEIMTTARRRLQPLLLTDRDRFLLRDILDFRMLTTEQVHALHFTSAHRCRKRLRLLWKHGFLTRHVRPVRSGKGSAQLLYGLTLKGWKAVVQEIEGRDSIASTKRKSIGEHAIKVNDVRVMITAALRHSPDTRLTDWKHDRHLKLRVRVPNPQGPATVLVIPDAFFTLTVRGRTFGYFLEVDRGTADLRRLQEKIRAYLALWVSDAAATLGVRSFRVLYVTTTEKRQTHLLHTLAGMGSQQRRDIISMTCFTRFTLTRPDELFSPNWQTVDQYGNTRSVSALPILTSHELPTVPSNPLVRGPDARAR